MDLKNKTSMDIASLVTKVRELNPLVHNITNYVTVNDCANILLAIGASPIMADDIREAAEITSISKALVINIGTLNTRTVDSMLASGIQANTLGIPVVLDPVGAGASMFRNEVLEELLKKVRVSIIRGNLSEISFLAGYSVTTKGVDTSAEDEKRNRIEVAKEAAKKYQCAIGITGKTDVITDGNQLLLLQNGHPRLSKITGSGCMTTALIGAYSAISDNMVNAAAAGILTMSIAGELAAKQVAQVYGNNHASLGSYHMAIMDAVSDMSEEIMRERAVINDETKD